MSLPDILWNKNIWGALVVIVLIIFGIMSVIFAYHWRRYGDDLKIIKLASFIFLVGAAAIITLIILTFQTLQ